MRQHPFLSPRVRRQQLIHCIVAIHTIRQANDARRVCSPGATCCDNNMARLPFSTTPAQQPIGSSGGFSHSRSVPIPKHLERENQPPEIRRFHDEMTTEPTHSHEHLHQPSTIEPAKGTTCSADGDALAVAWADGQDIFESIKQHVLLRFITQGHQFVITE